MIGKLGKDTFGEEFLEIMEQENINSSFILKDTNFSTGVGILILDQDNKIKALKSLESTGFI
jgi:sugar/nucleoside kinase (ribokinase family)